SYTTLARDGSLCQGTSCRQAHRFAKARRPRVFSKPGPLLGFDAMARRRPIGARAPERVGEVLSRSSPHAGAMRDAPLPLALWELTVGTRIAARTRPLRLEGGVLLVRVATAAWAHELAFLAPEIATRLAQRGVPVER